MSCTAVWTVEARAPRRSEVEAATKPNSDVMATSMKKLALSAVSQ